MKHQVTALVVAAGQGKRFGGPVSKQFVALHGKPLLYYTLRVFEQCAEIDTILAVLPPPRMQTLRSEIEGWGLRKFAGAVAGGAERHDSVCAGLAALPGDCTWVAIHDGVRPLVTPEVIGRTIAAAQRSGAAIAAVPPKDTVKRIDNDEIVETIDRRTLVMVQTPQVFRIDLIRRAYQHARETGSFFTDDAALVEAIGYPVKYVMGDYRNIKITSPEDWVFVQAFLEP